jgi:hypothetical protein
MLGRGTAQAGGERAARYLADRLAGLGLKPLGDARRSYMQTIKFRATQVLPQSALIVDEESLILGEEFVFAPAYEAELAEVSGPSVFVGYGYGKRRADVRGKIVVMLYGLPFGSRASDNPAQKAWQSREAMFALTGFRINGYAAAGASAIIVVNVESAEEPYPQMADYLMRRRIAHVPITPAARIDPAAQFYTTDKTRRSRALISTARQTTLPPVVYVSPQGSEKLFAEAGKTLAWALSAAVRRDFAPRELSGATIRARMKIEEATGSNVVGLLEGSDPSLKEEAVVFTAHYDAYGVGMDGRVYPGAADNALGVAEVMAVAEALAHSTERPRRSVIFLFTTGEEHGLLGSQHWEGYPTWSSEKLAAALNFDGIGTETYGTVRQVVGYGAAHSELGALLKEVTAAMGLSLRPDPLPEEKLFYRSDQLTFALHGVPPLLLMGLPQDVPSAVIRAREWLKTDYHQPADSVQPWWDWGGAQTMASVGLVVGMRVANGERAPDWLPSSPYRRFRQKRSLTSSGGQ